MKYTTPGMHTVEADSMKEAAQVFADRMARRQYGKRGHARTCNQESYAQDGSLAEYCAFIGKPGPQGSTVGSNARFTVYAA